MTTVAHQITSSTWQEAFLTMLPAITQQARSALRYLDQASLDDAVSEIVASTCCAFQRLFERGEQHRAFPSVLTKYAICQFFAGRRCGVRQSSRDVLSEIARQKHGFDVDFIGTPSAHAGGWRESLIDNRSTPVPDQVCFRIDFPRWLASLSARDRRIAERMSLGYSTREIAREFYVSPARVSQLRREFAKSWSDFHDEADTAVKAARI